MSEGKAATNSGLTFLGLPCPLDLDLVTTIILAFLYLQRGDFCIYFFLVILSGIIGPHDLIYHHEKQVPPDYSLSILFFSLNIFVSYFWIVPVTGNFCLKQTWMLSQDVCLGEASLMFCFKIEYGYPGSSFMIIQVIYFVFLLLSKASGSAWEYRSNAVFLAKCNLKKKKKGSD